METKSDNVDIKKNLVFVTKLLLIALCGQCGCTGYGAKHLIDRSLHREPPEWMYSIADDDGEIQVVLIQDTTYFRLNER